MLSDFSDRLLAITLSLHWSCSLQGRDLAFDSGALAFSRTLKKAGTALKELLLPTVEEVGLKTVLVAQVRDGNPLQQVLSKD